MKNVMEEESWPEIKNIQEELYVKAKETTDFENGNLNISVHVVKGEPGKIEISFTKYDSVETWQCEFASIGMFHARVKHFMVNAKRRIRTGDCFTERIIEEIMLILHEELSKAGFYFIDKRIQFPNCP